MSREAAPGSEGQVIEAAGVVALRDGASGPEVLVVHRARRDDWSLPKGKLEPGERHEPAAVRETAEETGVSVVLGPDLGERRYEVLGVPKRVRYWRATVLEEHPRAPDDEVDEVRWVPAAAAAALLSYEGDRELVDAATAVPDTTATVILRHAEAVKRAVWRESDDPLADDDALRPLSPEGNERAAGLVAMLGAYGVRRVVSSDARRCRATVEPYADEHGLAVEVAWTLSEQGAEFDPGETAQTVAALLDHVGPTVWCTHRPVLPFVVAAVARTLGLDPRDDRLDPRLRPGAALVLHRDPGGGIVAVDRLEPGP